MTKISKIHNYINTFITVPDQAMPLHLIKLIPAMSFSTIKSVPSFMFFAPSKFKNSKDVFYQLSRVFS